ncbi:MAG: hypothetical protein LBF15_04780 [Candidatus Peribacteria bacterium]|jgi:hypothetical protein|nr:hypothetical protein [Candidatus Peribacteria bacterium]
MTKTKKILLFVLFAVIILLLVIILSFNFKQDAPIEKESEIITQEREDVINLPTTHM